MLSPLKLSAMKLLLLLLFLLSRIVFGQNLIINPGAESDPGIDWTLVATGSACYTGSNWHIAGNQNGFPPAYSGNNFFYSGCNFVEGTIYQDIDVSGFATSIDAGASTFSFEGYMQVYAQTPPDNSRIIVEYRDASGVVLAQYDTGQQANQNVWTQYSDTRVAPVGTRTIRVQLMSYSFNGDSVDAYFDNLSLTHISILPVTLVFFDVNTDESREVQISWATSSEQNASHFHIERSVDCENWQMTSQVNAVGNSEQMYYYTTNDSLPIPGIAYYRLCQIDTDGTQTYFSPKSVVSKGDDVVLIPNPAVGETVFVQNTKSILGVYGPDGKTVQFQVLSVENGCLLILSETETGCYYIKSENISGNAVTSKLMME